MMNSELHSPLIHSSEEITLPFLRELRIDGIVLANFPDGTEILSAHPFGTSAWTVTSRIHLKLPSGEESHFFLKSGTGSHGRTLMEGEFNAMSEIYKWAPDLVPKPHSFGKLVGKEPEAYFFLSECIDMVERLPDPKQLGAKLAALHRESRSPNGQFGFHTTTCQGRIPQHVSWEQSWEDFFKKLLLHVIDLDFENNGHWEELDILEKRLLSHVIPRLLSILEANGQAIEPSLIHGDLWEGNIGMSPQNGNIYIFDAAAFYAHNEMETGNWRCHYNKIHDPAYTKAYLQHYEPSEPKDEWEDRNRLYSIYYNIIYSVNHLAEGKAVRQVAYNDIHYLVDKFAPFTRDQGPARLDTSQMATLSAERDHTV
ncbi:Fructosamine kinase-domain-containing protein [Xylariaceae sp. FL1019]|nr:Fructosamine kinase-domain-containing protein [Xylariaceae sp. FL1019]